MILLSFVALAGMLLVIFSPYFIVGSSMDSPVDLENLGIWDLDLYLPTAGYVVNNTTVIHEWPSGEIGGLTFGETGDELDKRVYVVRDSEEYDSQSEKVWQKYPDYIGIKRKADDIYGRVFRYAVPLETFIRNFDYKANISIVSFFMCQTNYSFVMTLVDNDTQRIWWNNYTLRVGKSIFQESTSGLWNAIKMVMLGQIPDCNKYVNMMVAIVVNFTWIFVLFVMISRIIPFLPGS